jgi:hypothetical protein
MACPRSFEGRSYPKGFNLDKRFAGKPEEVNSTLMHW